MSSARRPPPAATTVKSERALGEVRIIGGTLKRSKLAVLDRPGLRPTPDRVRETLFNWLAPRLTGTRVLDLCAGTGVLGLEAISRGAAHVQCNEVDPVLAARIRANADRLKVGSQLSISTQTAQVLLQTPPAERFDGVFVDPPYALDLWRSLLARLPAWLSPNAWVYLEHPREIAAPFDERWQVLREASAGQIHYYLLAPTEPSASVASID